MSDNTLELRVALVTDEAEAVRSYELRAASGESGESRGALPAFTAGAHIDLYLPNGLVRSYSLCNSPAERDRYLIAVQKDAASRGGSRHVFDEVRAGDRLRCGAPRNHFPLDEEAAHTVLIAGGIGITPLRSMIARLEALGRSWELHYCARTRERAAFFEELSRPPSGRGQSVHFNFDQEPGGRMLDLASVIAAARPGSHFYCCGPLPMLAAFESATAHLPREQVHLEYFAAKEDAAREGNFEVELARSSRVLQVRAGQSILDVVLEAGIDVAHACAEGVCGSCETAVLAGTPDHRDQVLTDEERRCGNTMMICCSGALGARLVLDL